MTGSGSGFGFGSGSRSIFSSADPGSGSSKLNVVKHCIYTRGVIQQIYVHLQWLLYTAMYSLVVVLSILNLCINMYSVTVGQKGSLYSVHCALQARRLKILKCDLS